MPIRPPLQFSPTNSSARHESQKFIEIPQGPPSGLQSRASPGSRVRDQQDRSAIQGQAGLSARWPKPVSPLNTAVWLEVVARRQHSPCMQKSGFPARICLVLALALAPAACGGSGGERNVTADDMLAALSEGAEGGTEGLENPSAGKANFSQDLLDKLAETESAAEAANLEEEIWEAWLLSGSPTVDMLMLRGVEATEVSDLELARDMFDRAIRIKPDYAEAWNRRALLFFNDGHYDEAISDLEVALTYEPRHFGAWTGLGMIFESIDEPDAALRAYRKVLEIHPHAAAAKQGEARLVIQVEGRSL